MTCDHCRSLLFAFAEADIAPFERVEVDVHLAGCHACREELAGLTALQSRLRRSLHTGAAASLQSPQAWTRLHEALAREALLSPVRVPAEQAHRAPFSRRLVQLFTGGMTVRKAVVMAPVMALSLMRGAVAAVPAVRAQAGETLAMIFSFKGMDVPMQPSYVPAGLDGGKLIEMKVTPESQT
ncbi:MAG: zf-HC2 domain-containing protein [Chloroflexi bacterium]|nr:zf-HC2 domain-containing protein [Chloroflexota bacterium]